MQLTNCLERQMQKFSGQVRSYLYPTNRVALSDQTSGTKSHGSGIRTGDCRKCGKGEEFRRLVYDSKLISRLKEVV